MCKPNGKAAIPAECPHRGGCSLCPMLCAVAAEEIGERGDALVRQRLPTPHACLVRNREDPTAARDDTIDIAMSLVQLGR
jgi:hypothetical protein